MGSGPHIKFQAPAVQGLWGRQVRSSAQQAGTCPPFPGAPVGQDVPCITAFPWGGSNLWKRGAASPGHAGGSASPSRQEHRGLQEAKSSTDVGEGLVASPGSVTASQVKRDKVLLGKYSLFGVLTQTAAATLCLCKRSLMWVVCSCKFIMSCLKNLGM